MNRGDAYKLLVARLEQLRGEGYDALLPRVGHAATSETIRLGHQDVVVEVQIIWADNKGRALRVRATALGPSSWMTERLEESAVIFPLSDLASS